MWYRMMAIAFLANGLGALGVRELNAMGLGESHGSLYLALWYSSGLLLAYIVQAWKGRKLKLREIALGVVMGLFSSIGWILLTFAMGRGIPGYVGFPVAIGGSLSVVAAVGVLVFRERLSVYGYLGILSGVAGIMVLATM
jgi:multidrug transporter EmrE-like cation transporter